MNPQTKRKSNAKYLWVAAAFVLLASLLPLYLYKSRFQPEGVVNRLLTEIRSGDLDRAYSLCSTSFQERVSRESFQLLLNPDSILKNAKELSIINQDISGGKTTLLVKIQSMGRPDQAIFIDLVHQNSDWKIDDFRAADSRLLPTSPRIKHAVKGPPFLLLFIASAILFIGGLCYFLLIKKRSDKWIFANYAGALVFSSCYSFYLQSWWAFFAALLYSLAFCFFVLVWSEELQATRSTVEDVEKLEGQRRFADLRAVLEKSQNAETKEAALNALMRILSELSSSNQSESRSRAVTWAGLIGHPRSLDILRKLSDDADPEIKKRALEVSGNIQKDGNVRKKRDRPGRRLVSKFAGILAILLPLILTIEFITMEEFGAIQLFVGLPLISLVIYWASVFLFYYVPLGILTALGFVLSIPEQMRTKRDQESLQEILQWQKQRLSGQDMLSRMMEPELATLRRKMMARVSSVGAQPECSTCHRPLKLDEGELPGPLPRTYLGTVCKSCAKIECNQCRGGVGLPCSACGGSVSPAFQTLFRAND